MVGAPVRQRLLLSLLTRDRPAQRSVRIPRPRWLRCPAPTNKQDDPEKWSWPWWKQQRWAWGTLGVLMILVAPHIRYALAFHLVEALGDAIVVAVVLSVIVDAWFRQELLKNAFHAV